MRAVALIGCAAISANTPLDQTAADAAQSVLSPPTATLDVAFLAAAAAQRKVGWASR